MPAPCTGCARLLPRRARSPTATGRRRPSIGMVFHLVSDADGDVIPIGRPIDNCYVASSATTAPLPRGSGRRDRHRRRLRGRGVPRRPEATGKRSSPTGSPAHPRRSRCTSAATTATSTSQGRLFFSGRRDFQVKIGGVRIELGEIEAAAQRCPGVYQAKALVAERDGDRVAGPVRRRGRRADPGRGCARRCARTLPRTSVPRHCSCCPGCRSARAARWTGASSRRCLNGRLDDRGRAAAARQRRTGTAPPGQCRLASAAGATLAGHALRAFRVRRSAGADLRGDADFMDAGGDSIRALIAVRMLTDAVRRSDLCVLDLLEHPTARQLGALHRHQRDRAPPPRRRKSPRSSRTPRTAARSRCPAGAAARRNLPDACSSPGPPASSAAAWCTTCWRSTDLRVLLPGPGGQRHRGRGPGRRRAGRTRPLGAALRQPPRRIRRRPGQPGLGLPTAAWRHLASTCDLVLHNGALVNLVTATPRTAGPTSRAPRRCCAWPCERRPVPVHYISTLSAVQAEARQRRQRAARGGPAVADARRRLAATARPSGSPNATWPGHAAEERPSPCSARRGAASRERPHPIPAALTHLLLVGHSPARRARPTAAIRSDYTPLDYAARPGRAPPCSTGPPGAGAARLPPAKRQTSPVRSPALARRSPRPAARVS